MKMKISKKGKVEIMIKVWWEMDGIMGGWWMKIKGMEMIKKMMDKIVGRMRIIVGFGRGIWGWGKKSSWGIGGGVKGGVRSGKK